MSYQKHSHCLPQAVEVQPEAGKGAAAAEAPWQRRRRLSCVAIQVHVVLLHLAVPLMPPFAAENSRAASGTGHGGARPPEAPAPASSQRNRVGLGPDGAQVRAGEHGCHDWPPAAAGSPAARPAGFLACSRPQPCAAAPASLAAAPMAAMRRPPGGLELGGRGAAHLGGTGARRGAGRRAWVPRRSAAATAVRPTAPAFAVPSCPQDPDLPLQRPQDLPWQGCAVHPRGWPGAQPRQPTGRSRWRTAADAAYRCHAAQLGMGSAAACRSQWIGQCDGESAVNITAVVECSSQHSPGFCCRHACC